MAKVDQLLSSLQKLYVKRSAVDKQIVEAEKKLAVEAKAVKPAASAKKAAGKPAVRKAAAKKPAAAPKPLLKK
jgi:hypothetical protein